MKKILKMLLLVFFLMIIYVYVLAIEKIPSKITLFEGEDINLKTVLGINFNYADTIETSSSEGTKKNIQVSFFDNIPIKNVDVNVIPKTKVIPLGNIAGVKLYTNGVLVVGMSEIEGKDNQRYKPYVNTGIEEGDTIIKVNNKEINSTDDLIETVNQSEGFKL